jgi:hypothetical protein
MKLPFHTPTWKCLFAGMLSFIGFQHIQAQNFSGKLILGVNGSQIDGDGMSGYYQPGLVFGAGARFPINEKLSIGPEIMYSQKGSRASFDQVTKLGYPRIIYRLNYVDLPIVAEYKVQPSMHIEGGLSFGYLLNAKLDPGGNLGFGDARYLFKNQDYQLLLGLKYRIFDDCWLSGRLMYSVISTNKLGLTNFNYSLTGSPGRGGFFNNLLQFTLSYRLFGAKETANGN